MPGTIIDGHDESGRTVLDDRGDAGYRRGHHGQPAEAGLDEHAGHALTGRTAAEEHDVGAPHPLGHIRP